MRIIASDLDGTLLNSQSKVSRENFDAIEELLKKGVHFVPSSGRTLSEVPEEIRENENIRYIIYSNGAAIRDKKNNEDILMCISKAEAKAVFDILYSYKIHITVRFGGKCYIDADCQTESDYEFYNVWQLHKEVINEYGIRKKDFKSFCYEADNFVVMSVFFHDESDMEECRMRLCDTGLVRVAEGLKCNLEICSIEAGKGSALKVLAKKLDIDIKDTIAVGDSDNDTSMIETAGLGLAMGNAIDSLKKKADSVICKNDEHAISYILKNYID